MELPKEEPVAPPPTAPVIDVEAYVPEGAAKEDWERMEAKERESSKKPAPTSYLDGL
jgi:hypothetical protein